MLLCAKERFSIPKPLHRVRPLAPQLFQLPHWPGKMRRNTTALEDYFSGACLSARNTLARSKAATALLSNFQ